MPTLALNLADGVVAYWQRSSAHWFSKDRGFDERFRERFLSLHLAAASRRCDGWMDDATGALALMILLDQYPRNAFRGTAHMYATDGLALHFARQAEARGYMNAVEAPMRLFFCLPFAHSEDLADQDHADELNTLIGPAAREHALGHRNIIVRFGRFPHRNPVLGRQTTAAEQAFLDRGGFAG